MTRGDELARSHPVDATIERGPAILTHIAALREAYPPRPCKSLTWANQRTESLLSESIFLLMTTVSDQASAEALTRLGLEQHLAACVSRSPVHSSYRWEGKIEHAEEISLVFKTSRARVDALAKAIAARHPYDCPEIASWPAEASPAYAQWVDHETQVAPRV